MTANTGGKPFFELRGIEREDDRELLESMGYEVSAFNFYLMTPENFQTFTQSDEVPEDNSFNRTHTFAGSLEELGQKLEEESTVVVQYSHESYEREVEKRLAEIFSESMENGDPRNDFLHEKTSEFLDFVEEANQPTEEDEVPRVIRYPLPVELDSRVEDYSFIEEIASENRAKIESISYILNSPGSFERGELPDKINEASLHFNFGDYESVDYWHLGDQSYWTVVVDDDLEDSYSEDLLSRDYEVHKGV